MDPKLRRLVLLFCLAALVLAACGGGVTEDELPVYSDPDSAPPAAGACLENEPDCDDTGALPDEANPLPPPSDDDAIVSDGMPAQHVLTVSETLVADIGGVIAVEGFLFDDGSGPMLCETLAESFPPRCGEASLMISGHEEAVDVPLLEEQNVIWTDEAVVLIGEIVGGTLVVDPTVTG